ncbi:MAG: hypothetical protein J6T48_01390 [Bacteroidales bacterium]|nr:hypothetical protein [Bacteroidales bacterium]
MLNKRFILFLLLAITFSLASAQQNEADTVRYDYSFSFNNGLYTSFYSFRNNAPIPFERFVSPTFDEKFFKNILKCETISYYDENGTLNEIPRKLIWGYASNGKPNILWAGKFNLIPYIGTISHFMSTETVTRYINSTGTMMYDPMYIPSTQTYTTEELMHYFIDMNTGNITSYGSNSLLELIKDDSEIYEEYASLRKRKRNRSVMEYVQKYNKKHPIYFNK